MKHQLKHTLLVILTSFIYQAQAQFTVNGQYMGRAEMRHGFQTLADTNQKPSIFVSQRARMNAEYKSSRYKVYIAVQDIRTWGSVANAAIDTKGLLSVYEAYGEVFIRPKFSVKMGRQAIAHGDERIFGSLDWAMQGRRHDAMVFNYADSSWRVETGFAYNQDAESSRWSQYTVNNYKTFQYIWYNQQFKKLNLGALILNTGFVGSKMNQTTQKLDTLTLFTQTLGARADYNDKKFSVGGFVYAQFGKDPTNRNVKAVDISVEGSLKPNKEWILTLGTEYISGTSQVDTANKENNSFNPYFGTNHRFNGYMDYFYVNNHLNSVGLHDVFYKTTYVGKRFLAGINLHYFSAAADIRNKNMGPTDALGSRYLGFETDLTFGFQIADGCSLQGGYSQMFGSTGLQTLRGVSSLTPNSNWAYLMLMIRPNTPNKFPRTGLKM